YRAQGNADLMTTWNPSDDSGVTLSSGDMVATANAGTNGGARGTTSNTAGQFYIEYQVHGPQNDNVYVGFATTSTGFEGADNSEFFIVLNNNGNVQGDNGALDNSVGYGNLN